MIYTFVKYAFRLFFLFAFRIKVVGREKVLKSGGALFACNHKSNWDALVVLATCPRRLAFMGKAELFKFKPFALILKAFGAFPVNRGKGDISAIKTSLRILKEENSFIMFPEGKRVKKYDPTEVKPGVAMISTRARVPICPVTISGSYKWMNKITITYGDPIYFDEYYDEKLSVEKLQEMSVSVMDNIYAVDSMIGAK